MQASPVLLLSPSPATHDVLAAAARACLDVHTEHAAAAAEDWLESHHPPAILVDDRGGSAPAACEQVRWDPRLANIPIVAMSHAISELPFERMLSAGADDLCAPSEDKIATRLQHVASAGKVPLPPWRGTAVIADGEQRSRVVLARALRRVGYDVRFALDVEQAVSESSAPGVALVVWRPTTADGADAPSRARAAGCVAPWVIGVAPKDVAPLRAAVGAVPNVAVYDAFGPPENVLFVANELSNRAGREARATSRALYGTTVQFRLAGAEEDEIGYTFNISAGGLYVRTLAPPPRDAELWLELRPPRAHRRVRLEARVVWTMAFGVAEAATAPPGFGAQITGGSVGDLELYVRRCHDFTSSV